MTAEQPAPLIPADEAVARDREHGGLQPVERGYIQVLRVGTLVSWLPLIVGAVVVDFFVLEDSEWQGLLGTIVPLIAALSVLLAPRRIWMRLGYALEPAMLRVVRGWVWHVDTLVPLVRVQHLDIARGPLDKAFGTASLVVHTAGTHNSIVKLPGLSPERAGELAAIIRTHIQADLD